MAKSDWKKRVSVSHRYQSVFFWLILFASLVGGFLLILISNKELYVEIAKEGANAELMTAVFYLIAGVLCLWSAFKHRRDKRFYKPLILPFLIGLFFIFIAGEEESWGQWLFDFDTPEALSERNYQDETNIHNLDVLQKHQKFLDPHRILNLFALLFGVVLPLLYKYSRKVRHWLNRIGFPVCPLACSSLFLLAMFYEKIAYQLYDHWSHPEIMEFMFSIGFVLFGVSLLRGDNVLQDTNS